MVYHLDILGSLWYHNIYTFTVYTTKSSIHNYMSLSLHVNIIHFGQALQVLFITCCLPSTNFLNYHLQLLKNTRFRKWLWEDFLRTSLFFNAVSWILGVQLFLTAFLLVPNFPNFQAVQLDVNVDTSTDQLLFVGRSPGSMADGLTVGWLVAGDSAAIPPNLEVTFFPEKITWHREGYQHEVQANVLFFFENPTCNEHLQAPF